MTYRQLLSRRRTAVMGLQAILIVFFHAPWEGSPRWMTLLGRPGSLGVDVFVFLAGFGLARAIDREPRFDAYMARRARRVLPAYYAAVLMLFVAMALTRRKVTPAALGWLGQQLVPLGVMVNREPFFWYVSAALGYYAMAPLLYGVLRGARYPRLTAALLMALTGLALPWLSRMDGIDRAMARIPTLVAGLAAGLAFRREGEGAAGQAGDLLCFAALAALGVAGIALNGGPLRSVLRPELLRRLCRTLLAPLLTVLWALAFEAADRLRVRGVGALFEHLGRYSLEIYLGHFIVLSLMEHIHHPLRLPAMAAGGYALARLMVPAGRGLLRAWDALSGRMRRTE